MNSRENEDASDEEESDENVSGDNTNEVNFKEDINVGGKRKTGQMK